MAGEIQLDSSEHLRRIVQDLMLQGFDEATATKHAEEILRDMYDEARADDLYGEE